jgi:hypothetical protein
VRHDWFSSSKPSPPLPFMYPFPRTASSPDNNNNNFPTFSQNNFWSFLKFYFSSSIASGQLVKTGRFWMKKKLQFYVANLWENFYLFFMCLMRVISWRYILISSSTLTFYKKAFSQKNNIQWFIYLYELHPVGALFNHRCGD